MAEEQDARQLTATVARARRRVLANRALHEAVLAVTVTLLGPTLLLLLGRRWLGPGVLIGFAVSGVGIAGWRLWRRRPNLYHVAQTLDGRLCTADQISTALHFLSAGSSVAAEQRRMAAHLAARASVEAAFPFTVPRSVYGLATVFLAASALWALRFFLEKPMQLDHSLARAIAGAVGGREELVVHARNGGPEPRPAQKPGAIPTGDQQRPNGQGREPGQETTAPGSDAGAKNGDDRTDPDGRSATDPSAAKDEFGDPMASSDPMDEPIQSYEDMLERDAKSGLSKNDGKNGKNSESNGNQKDGSGGNPEANSLLSKLRDAMNQMLSRLQQKSSGKGAQQQAANGMSSNEGEPQDGRGEGKNGAGQPQPGGEQASNGEGAEGESKDGEPQNAAGKAGGKSADGGSRNSAGDGAGQQEGDKTISEAEHEEVLGKLSELYGRRAANVTGEVTVETQSGKQTLRTPQTQRAGRHADSGGQISRDEIPLAYQAYIKEYFSRLRQSDKK